MKPRHLFNLHQVDTALAEIVQSYPEAVRRLQEDVMPVFPSKTPGNGDPPGGTSGHAKLTSTERLADQRLAGRLRELVDLEQLQAFPVDLTERVHVLLDAVGHVGGTVGLPSYRRDPVARFEWARWAVRQLIAGAAVVDLDADGVKALNRLAELVAHRRDTVSWWGYTPKRPVLPKLALDELADDPTENWCRSCLRVGVRSPRYRGDLCRWCYEFHGAQRFLPPAEIIVARAEGKRITEAMVNQHRPAKKGKKKGRRR